MANYPYLTGGSLTGNPAYAGSAAIPGYATQATSTTSSGIPELRPSVVSGLQTALKGELPQDVTDQIRQHAAEFGVASGMPGSEFSGYAGLKNLGLTSLDEVRRAQSLLAPEYRQSTSYSGNPHGNVNMNIGMGGTVPATLQRSPSAPGQPEPLAKEPDHNALIGDFLAKYLPGSKGGSTSTGMAPMGSTPSDLRLAVPGFGTGLNIAGTMGRQQPTSSGSMFSGSQDQYDQYLLDQLAQQGVADPSWASNYDPFGDLSGSFTGDINSDSGEDYYG